MHHLGQNIFQCPNMSEHSFDARYSFFRQPMDSYSLRECAWGFFLPPSNMHSRKKKKMAWKWIMEILIGNLYSVRVSFSLAASRGSATALWGTEQEISLRLARTPGGRRDRDFSASLMHALEQVYFLVLARGPRVVVFLCWSWTRVLKM